jgi:hypothetical protein
MAKERCENSGETRCSQKGGKEERVQEEVVRVEQAWQVRLNSLIKKLF